MTDADRIELLRSALRGLTWALDATWSGGVAVPPEMLKHWLDLAKAVQEATFPMDMPLPPEPVHVAELREGMQTLWEQTQSEVRELVNAEPYVRAFGDKVAQYMERTGRRYAGLTMLMAEMARHVRTASETGGDLP